MALKITFVLPSYLRSPCGGFKVVYELADRLAGRGHRVVVVHPRSLEPAGGPWAALKANTWPWRTRQRHGEVLPWFRFDHDVEVRLTPDLRARSFPDADVVVATAWQTAVRVAELPPAKGRKLLYAMDFEHWATADGEAGRQIAAAFRQPFSRLASSPAVAGMLEDLGCEVAAVVVAAVAAEDFALDRPPEERRAIFGFPLRTESWKGTRDAFAAFDLLRARRPGELEVRAFGVLPAPELPSWVSYLHQPDDAELRRFYNDLAVFLLPSRYEGWGLPGPRGDGLWRRPGRHPLRRRRGLRPRRRNRAGGAARPARPDGRGARKAARRPPAAPAPGPRRPGRGLRLPVERQRRHLRNLAAKGGLLIASLADLAAAPSSAWRACFWAAP